jgi:oligoribonuclease
MLGVFLDSEANGLNPQIHKIIEIAFQIVDLKTGFVKFKYQTLITHPFTDWEKSDQSSLKMTGFTWNEVSQGKTLDIVSQEIIDCFKKHGVIRKKAVFICQNPSFDRTYFSQIVDTNTQELMSLPYHWLDLASMHWALTMEKAKKKIGPYPWDTGISKDRIAHFYQIPPEQSPHRAMNGVCHLLECYQAVVGFPALR